MIAGPQRPGGPGSDTARPALPLDLFYQEIGSRDRELEAGMPNHHLLAKLGVSAALAAAALGVSAGSATAHTPPRPMPTQEPFTMSPDPLGCLLSTGSSAFCIG